MAWTLVTRIFFLLLEKVSSFISFLGYDNRESNEWNSAHSRIPLSFFTIGKLILATSVGIYVFDVVTFENNKRGSPAITG